MVWSDRHGQLGEGNLQTLGLDQLAAVNLRVMDSQAADPSQPGQLHRAQFDQQLTRSIHDHEFVKLFIRKIHYQVPKYLLIVNVADRGLNGAS